VANRAPTAVADFVSTDEDVAATFTVLANDTDPDGDTLSITAIGATDHGGTVAIAGTAVSYTPAPQFFGTEHFTYTISDGLMTSQTTVTVSVIAVNHAPRFIPGPNQTVNRNAPAQTIPGWAT